MPKSHTVLLLETIHPDAVDRLQSYARVVSPASMEENRDPEEIVRREPVHAIMTRGKGQVREPLLDLCSDLQVVARVGVGLDNIDVGGAISRGITVINAPGSTTTATAEHTFLLMAALVRGLIPVSQATKAGNWASRQEYRGDDLSGLTLGVIGMGAIARRFSTLAASFGMTVVYTNRTEKEVPYTRCSLTELLPKSDVVSLHVALTPETRHILGRKELEAMKPGAALVNTARGGLVNQDVLVELLSSGHIGGFAADVLEQEPPSPDDPLLQFENVILTPHVAALTESTYRAMCLRSVDNVIAALTGAPVLDGDTVTN